MRLDLSAARGDPMTLAEFGRLVAEEEDRDSPYTAATVSGWEQGAKEPTLATLGAIAAVGNIPREALAGFLLGDAPRLRETPIKRVSSAAERKRKRKGA